MDDVQLALELLAQGLGFSHPDDRSAALRILSGKDEMRKLDVAQRVLRSQARLDRKVEGDIRRGQRHQAAERGRPADYLARKGEKRDRDRAVRAAMKGAGKGGK